MGLFDTIKSKLKGNKKAQEGLDVAKAKSGDAIDAAAAKVGVDAGQTGAIKTAAADSIDKVKAEIA